MAHLTYFAVFGAALTITVSVLHYVLTYNEHK
jgi:hypothetical protein